MSFMPNNDFVYADAPSFETVVFVDVFCPEEKIHRNKWKDILMINHSRLETARPSVNSKPYKQQFWIGIWPFDVNWL